MDDWLEIAGFICILLAVINAKYIFRLFRRPGFAQGGLVVERPSWSVPPPPPLYSLITQDEHINGILIECRGLVLQGRKREVRHTLSSIPPAYLTRPVAMFRAEGTCSVIRSSRSDEDMVEITREEFFIEALEVFIIEGMTDFNDSNFKDIADYEIIKIPRWIQARYWNLGGAAGHIIIPDKILRVRYMEIQKKHVLSKDK